MTCVQGSGKTLAFGLPIINFLVKEAQRAADEAHEERATDANIHSTDDNEGHAAQGEPMDVNVQNSASGHDGNAVARSKLRALILCPTRELAAQVATHLEAIAKPLALRVVPLVGGVAQPKQDRLLRYQPPVVVATPGRLWDVMRRGNAHVDDLTGLSFLVLDEADRMVQLGCFEELGHILSRIPRPSAERGRKRSRLDPGADPDSTAAPADGPPSRADADAGAASRDDSTTEQTLAGTLHTYVFSATLALSPEHKAQLQRGKGGSRGSAPGATFESLLERLAFRGKPKVWQHGRLVRPWQTSQPAHALLL